ASSAGGFQPRRTGERHLPASHQ
ncbi:hypothetical protein AZZ66_000664, partial [Escherichia coli]